MIIIILIIIATIALIIYRHKRFKEEQEIIKIKAINLKDTLDDSKDKIDTVRGHYNDVEHAGYGSRKEY